ncbi:putative F420-0 ABC transporter substrate-binding protein [Serinibacter arcticus]|uniref:ABC transporter (Iron.B12.siderophore.hemin), periplasmic substrate-binding component n=1 Tax=Serinibacter arcticus TaxID=1655435 RepID=A0A4Z1E973_9MICO|nr:putative F420-0 ABC transporter substrate-binding protein [Serinibacter arcticus]TGO05981.1 ABC transporter (iron.B12.siderophore.hemin), periplasmic substrate-binding component [Serinibacter arcticus]
MTARPTRRPTRRTLVPAGAVLLATALLAACGTSGSGDGDATSSAPSDAPSDAPTDASSTPTTPAGYTAFTADNCGFSVDVEAAPERIVTIKSAMTDLVLALGAGDRLVATAYPDSPPVDAADADLVASLPVLADRVPTNEAVLSVEPDLVLAGWESNFSADGAGERSALTDLDVATFVAPSACTQAPYLPDPLTFQDVFDEVTQVGDLLGESEAAQELVATQTAALEELRAERAGASSTAGDPATAATALWWSSGSDTPYVGAGTGAPQMIMDEVGLTNIAGDLAGGWGPYSWEAATAADPDVIVLVDSSWNTAEKKKETLAANPVTASLRAVQEERYLVVPFAATEGGVRNVEAVRTLTEQLTDLQAAGA